MEEWLDFADAFSPHVLHDLPWGDSPDEQRVREVFETMWASLRFAVLYFMKFNEGQHTSERILEAQEALLEYGRLAEEVRLRPLHVGSVDVLHPFCCPAG